MPVMTRNRSSLLAAVGWLLLSAAPARADLIETIQSVSALPGSGGNALEVILENTGAPVTVAAFTFNISTADSDITFTGIDGNTTGPYIFAGDSFDAIFNGGSLTFDPPGQTMNASDLSNSGNGTLIGTGTTFDLGRILFNVAPNATLGSFAVTLSTDPAQTSLSDANFDAITIDTFNNGQVTITSVPEPASALLVAAALVGVAVAKRRTKHRA